MNTTPDKPVSNEPAPPNSKPGRKFSPILLVIVLAVFAGAIYEGIRYRMHAEAKSTRVALQSSVPFVKVIHPVPGSNAGEISLPGNVEAFTDASIYAQTSGYLRAWYADIGAHVKKDQLLADIDTPEVDEQLLQAQGDLKNAQANLAISKTTSDRYQALLKSNSVSREEADQAASDLISKQALSDASTANVERLLKMKNFQKVYAPFDGVITARGTDIGDLVQAGDSTASRELFHLSAINSLRVYISVPEVYSSTIKTGNKVTLTVDSSPGQKFTGIIARDSDSINSATRTLNVEVDVNNSDGSLLPGAYAFVHIPTPALAGSMTIPSDTLLFRSEGLRVGVVRDGHVILTAVIIGHDYGSTVEVVSGLAAQDDIIVDPSDSLSEGAPVQVDQTPAAK